MDLTGEVGLGAQTVLVPKKQNVCGQSYGSKRNRSGVFMRMWFSAFRRLNTMENVKQHPFLGRCFLVFVGILYDFMALILVLFLRRPVARSAECFECLGAFCLAP